MGATKLSRQLDALEKLYGRPAPTRDLFELVLWENVAYLVDDERRKKAFTALKSRVGTAPEDILKASFDTLYEIAKPGGMRREDRLAKLRSIAETTLEEFGGDLGSLAELPEKKAVNVLTNFPSIGVPGAARLLLFAGIRPVFALESNGLRALVRFGYADEKKSYAATYRAVREAVSGKIVPKVAWRQRAHLLLRHHGRELCRRQGPICESCPLSRQCRFRVY